MLKKKRIEKITISGALIKSVQILIKYKDMKAKSFFSLIFCLLLVSCNKNEMLENELDTLSYLEGVWERVDYSIVTLKNGKERIDNSTLYGYIGPKYFLFEKDVLVCYSYAPDMILESHYFYQEYMYKYNTQTQLLTLVNDEEIDYIIKKVTEKYMVLDENVKKGENVSWLRLRLKKITREEFEKTEHYKKAYIKD